MDNQGDNGKIASDVKAWWMAKAEADVEKLMPKLTEYGSHDLTIMGDSLAEWLQVPREMGVELACCFYLLGKVGRMVSAYRRGERASEDTLQDAVAYASMCRYAQEHDGRWP